MTFIRSWNKKIVAGVNGTFNVTDTTFSTIGAFVFDPAVYPGIYTFQASLEVTSGYTVEAQLYDVTGSGIVSGSVLDSVSLTPEIQDAVVVLSNSGIYEVQLRVTSSGGIGTCKFAGINVG